MYAIVDIETTGNGFSGMKITEISIFKYDGTQVVDEYTTLVNPECHIPPFITNLTGITNAMVAEAPKFYEVAKEVHLFTEDTVFVAHNVNFDYGIIKREFQALGFEFHRKKLCTVRLSRKLIPGLNSYSLGPLCEAMDITIVNRHRARGDAEATVVLLGMLLKKDKDQEVFGAFLNPRSRQATLPPLLPKEVFDTLPESHGVYYFRNSDNTIIYVGKANNIKQRVLGHFYSKAKKEISLGMETANLTYEVMGSELLSLLWESAEIKKHYPKYNRAQRRKSSRIALFAYKDTLGIQRLAYGKTNQVSKPLLGFDSVMQCRAFLEKICMEYQLCPQYCQLQQGSGGCFHYQIKQCQGVCRGQEAVSQYNKRVTAAIRSFGYTASSFVIWERGRSTEEKAFVLVVDGVYKGFGFAPHEAGDWQHYLRPQHDNRDIQRILRAYLKKNPEKCEALEDGISCGDATSVVGNTTTASSGQLALGF